MEWWKNENREEEFVKYKLNKLTVLIGPRLDCHGCSEKFYNSIDYFISVTDRFVRHRSDKNFIWFPWIEERTIPPEVIFGAANVFHYLLEQDKEMTIYLHCDGGTHRAPSTLGAVLHILFKDTKEKIVDEATTDSTYYRDENTGELRTDPLVYISRYIKDYKTFNIDLNKLFTTLREIIINKENKFLEDILKDEGIDYYSLPVKNTVQLKHK